MSDIPALIQKLQDPSANKRFDACEQLRVAPALPSEAIAALQAALNDPDRSVRDSAESALKVRLSVPEQSVQQLNGATLAKASTRAYWTMFGILTVLFLVFSTAAQWESSCVGILFIVYAVLSVAIYQAYTQQTKAMQKAAEDESLLKSIQEQYQSVRAQTMIPASAKQATYKWASSNSPIKLAKSENGMYIWKSEDAIYFFPTAPLDAKSLWISEVKINSIPVSRIEYFAKKGEIFRETKISGGGGGGSSIGGAVAGGILAGGTGAVIGSRKKVNEIKSELVTHDTRETFLNYYDGSEKHSLFFDIGAYEIFNDLIPEKAYDIVSAIKSAEIIKAQTVSQSIKSVPEQLRELAKLRDDGIITEDDFNATKKQLLAKIA